LPNFDQPQINLYAQYGGLSPITSRASMAALSDRILLVSGFEFNQFTTHENYLGSSFCQSWPHWNLIGTDGTIPGAASNWVPGLASWGTGALAVWNGLGSDTRLWCSQYNRAGNVWSSQYLTQLSGTGKPIQSGSGPALVNFNGVLLIVWLGEGSNDGLYYATSRDGRTWTGNQSIPGAGSSIQPALAVFNGAPVLCFKGVNNDGGIYSTTYHASSDSWAPVVPTGPFGTSHGPTLAVYQGKLFMAWKGAGGDTDLYWSTTSDNLNRNAWAGQSVISNVGSAVGPAAVVY
jgi:hypothetical protein